MGPCCCCSSKKGSKVIAGWDIFCGIVFLVQATLMLAKEYDLYGGLLYSDLTLPLIATMVTSFGLVLLGIGLRCGIRKNSQELVKLWLVARAILMVVGITNFVVAVFTGSHYVTSRAIFTNTISIFLSIWYILVVLHFLMHEMPQRADGQVYQQTNPEELQENKDSILA